MIIIHTLWNSHSHSHLVSLFPATAIKDEPDYQNDPTKTDSGLYLPLNDDDSPMGGMVDNLEYHALLANHPPTEGGPWQRAGPYGRQQSMPPGPNQNPNKIRNDPDISSSSSMPLLDDVFAPGPMRSPAHSISSRSSAGRPTIGARLASTGSEHEHDYINADMHLAIAGVPRKPGTPRRSESSV